MKLTEELKKKIDNYFEKISAEDLYRISVRRYGFVEDISFEVEESFTLVTPDRYSIAGDGSFFNSTDGDSYNSAA